MQKALPPEKRSVPYFLETPQSCPGLRSTSSYGIEPDQAEWSPSSKPSAKI